MSKVVNCVDHCGKKYIMSFQDLQDMSWKWLKEAIV
jgi:hypothetical protein